MKDPALGRFLHIWVGRYMVEHLDHMLVIVHSTASVVKAVCMDKSAVSPCSTTD